MEQQEAMEQRLWEYIDGLGSEEQRSAIAQLLAKHAEWRAKYNELLHLHQMIGAIELEQPSMRFTRNVMEEIARHRIAPATRNYINNKIIWGIATFFIVIIAGYLVYGFSQIEWRAGTGSKTIVGIDFSKVDYSRIFNNSFVNAFVMLNIVLGLMLLDRFLGQRKKEWNKAY